MRLWSADVGACLVAYRGHNYPVWDVKWAPGAASSASPFYFASASHDTTARLWGMDRAHALRIFAGHLGVRNCD